MNGKAKDKDWGGGGKKLDKAKDNLQFVGSANCESRITVKWISAIDHLSI